ncbi:MAG: hypothetical protein CMJ74_13485 [Planctomycetaceae bacterium]|nr:hypothetical protein [Planctomycetaceae bacterium]|tara:strand:+ start:869 stop:1135 length:267 start_codon:yes stop_codon:yes gene_type:complete
MNQEDPLNLTTLIKLTDSNLAEILKLALADEEIECVIEGEHQAGLTGVFQIRVLVPQKDLSHAELILQEHVTRMEEDAEQQADDPEDS